MQNLEYGPFKVNVTLRDFTVSRGEGTLNFIPTEAEKVIQLVIHALSLHTWKVLPEKIQDTPIRVRFNEDRLLYLDLLDGRSGEIAFRFEEGDELIAAMKGAVNKFRDMTTIQKGRKKSFSSAHIPDPVIIGR